MKDLTHGPVPERIDVADLPFLPLDRLWDVVRHPRAAELGWIVPPPALYADLTARARASGFRVRNLYVLANDLALSRAACYDQATGDIWIRASSQDDPYFILHELAHAAVAAEPAKSLDDYRAIERAVIQRARELAVAWGIPEVLTPERVGTLLAEEEEHHAHSLNVGHLIGSLDPGVVSRTDEALYIWGVRHGWSLDALLDALKSEGDSPLLDIDRGFLLYGGQIGDVPAGDPFGVLSLAPDRNSGYWLRCALFAAAEAPPYLDAYPVGGSTFMVTARIADAFELADGISAVQSFLVGNFERAPETTWWCYGNSAAPRARRIYRALLQFDAGKRVEVWVLFKRNCEPGVEAALQRYIRSWGRVCRILTDSYAAGRSLLDGYQEMQRLLGIQSLLQ